MRGGWQGGDSLYWRHDPGADYISAVKVTCCNEADGPDNLWMVESGALPLFSRSGFDRVLEGLSYFPTQNVPSLRELVYALDSYWGVERDSMRGESYVQVGAKRRGGRDGGLGSMADSDYVIHGNASLDRFIRLEFLD